MLTVYKYPVPVTPREFSLMLPDGAEVLTLQLQDGAPTIWAKVETDAPNTQRDFLIVGTGWELEFHGRPFRYVGTFQPPSGFVWHLFEKETF